LQRQPVHAAPHVGAPNRQPDVHAGGEGNQRRSSASSTTRRPAAFTPPPTRTR
jgi:hypothetical protein